MKRTDVELSTDLRGWADADDDPSYTNDLLIEAADRIDEFKLIPAEHMAFTVARAQIARGVTPTPNITAVCVAALGRLIHEPVQGVSYG